ncbi:MAG: hypothetical protein WBR35_15170, partial [Anaerolineae bacterium]
MRRFLPTPGNVLFTLLMIGLLLWASSAGALPLRLLGPNVPSTTTIAYQGRLADAGGSPLTGAYSIIFRLYNAASGGVPLWEEQWTGQNGVQVSDGLFNVMLGSLTPIPQTVVTGNNTLWLGITVGTDDEMAPRVQLGSVPFAVQALTVPDGSVTTTKIADQAVTQAKLGDGSVRSRHLAPQRYEAHNSTAKSTTNTTLVETGTSVTINCETACTAFIQHRGLIQHSVANGRVDVVVTAGAVNVFSELGISSEGYAFEPVSGSGFINLPAGNHLISVLFACSPPGPSGTCYYYGDSSAGYWEHLDVLVFAQS